MESYPSQPQPNHHRGVRISKEVEVPEGAGKLIMSGIARGRKARQKYIEKSLQEEVFLVARELEINPKLKIKEVPEHIKMGTFTDSLLQEYITLQEKING